MSITRVWGTLLLESRLEITIFSDMVNIGAMANSSIMPFFLAFPTVLSSGWALRITCAMTLESTIATSLILLRLVILIPLRPVILSPGGRNGTSRISRISP